MNATDTQFVGESRKKVVNGLLTVFQECVENHTPRWVSLEGPSGCGKSRVVREFYRVLSQGQEIPRYWPESLISDGDPAVRDVHARRKRVAPIWPGSPGAIPTYMWWGVDCGELNGTPSERLAIALKQFVEHAEPLDKAYAESVQNGLKLQQLLRSSWAALCEEGSGEISTMAIEKAVQVITNGLIEQLPGAGLVLRTAQWAWTKRQNTNTRDATIAEGKLIEGGASLEPIDEAFETLRRLTYRAIVPAIVFIEDLHYADEALIEVLQRLLRSSENAVMVITTTWSGELDQLNRLAPLARLFGKELILGDRFHRLTETGPDRDESPVQGAFASLEIDCKVQIVRDYVPDVSGDVAQALAERYDQPLLLELVLSSSWLQEDYGEYLERLSIESIGELPATIDSYYLATWERLPKSVKDTLVYATLAVPHVIDTDFTRPNLEWSLQLLVNTLDHAGIAHSCVSRFDEEPRILGWAERVDGRLSRFREWQHLDHTLRMGTLSDDRRIKALHVLGAQASEAILSDTGGFGESGYLENLLLALAFTKKIGSRRLSEPLLTERAVIQRVASRRMRALSAFPREHKEAIRLGEIALKYTASLNTEEAVDLRVIIATLKGESGDAAGALKLFQSLLPDTVQVLGTNHTDTFTTRNNIAMWTGKCGDNTTALDLFQSLLPDMLRVLGPDDPKTLATRNNIAMFSGESGDNATALKLLHSLLSDMLRVLGPDDPKTLATRDNIAARNGYIGDKATALMSYQSLLPDMLRVLGPHHPDTLRTRNNIAMWTGKCGDNTTALDLFQSLLPDMLRVLGPDNPKTLRTRNNIAIWTGRCGKIVTALTLFQSLLQDQERLLGPDHPDTLITRNNIAAWTGYGGDNPTSLELFQSLLPEMIRVLGPDNPMIKRCSKHIERLSSQ